jgi:hypothetical protein
MHTACVSPGALQFLTKSVRAITLLRSSGITDMPEKKGTGMCDCNIICRKLAMCTIKGCRESLLRDVDGELFR